MQAFRHTLAALFYVSLNSILTGLSFSDLSAVVWGWAGGGGGNLCMTMKLGTDSNEQKEHEMTYQKDKILQKSENCHLKHYKKRTFERHGCQNMVAMEMPSSINTSCQIVPRWFSQKVTKFGDVCFKIKKKLLTLIVLAVCRKGLTIEKPVNHAFLLYLTSGNDDSTKEATPS